MRSTATAPARWRGRQGRQRGAGRDAPRSRSQRQRGQRGRTECADAGRADRQRRRCHAPRSRRSRRQPAGTLPRPVGGDVGGCQSHPDMVAFLVSKGADCPCARKPTTGRRRSPTSRACSIALPRPHALLYAARAGSLAACRSSRQPAPTRTGQIPDCMTPMIMALDNGYPASPVPARAGRQPAHVGLVGAHAALCGGDDAWRPGRPGRGKTAGVAGADQGAARGRRESERAARVQGAQPRRTRQSIQGRLLTTGATPLLRAAQTSTTTSSWRCSRTARSSICRTRQE